MDKPPYKLDSEILNKVIKIAEKIGQINALLIGKSSPELRKQNKIKTIHASLKIEGNTLSENQITALIDNKRVLGPEKDIIEVRNAIEVYDNVTELSPFSEKDFLRAHKLLMEELILDAGKYRKSGVGIVKGSQVAHLAPPAELLPSLMKNLFEYVKKDKDHDLIKAAVFHYELEFIHPFSDGNGRMGRLWNTVILMNSFPLFEFIPFESIISKYQKRYYQALATSDKSGESSTFIIFMLDILDEALEPFLNMKEISIDPNSRIQTFLASWKGEFKRSDYLTFFKHISSSTASRDLHKAVKDGLIRKLGEKNQTYYSKRTKD